MLVTYVGTAKQCEQLAIRRGLGTQLLVLSAMQVHHQAPRKATHPAVGHQQTATHVLFLFQSREPRREQLDPSLSKLARIESITGFAPPLLLREAQEVKQCDGPLIVSGNLWPPACPLHTLDEQNTISPLLFLLSINC
jgi:hypothetical protein